MLMYYLYEVQPISLTSQNHLQGKKVVHMLSYFYVEITYIVQIFKTNSISLTLIHSDTYKVAQISHTTYLV